MAHEHIFRICEARVKGEVWRGIAVYSVLQENGRCRGEMLCIYRDDNSTMRYVDPKGNGVAIEKMSGNREMFSFGSVVFVDEKGDLIKLKKRFTLSGDHQTVGTEIDDIFLANVKALSSEKKE